MVTATLFTLTYTQDIVGKSMLFIYSENARIFFFIHTKKKQQRLIIYLIIFKYTRSQVQNVEYTFSSQEDTMMKLNDETYLI